MKKIFFILLFSNFATAQETIKTGLINPKENWYYGIESGLNIKTSLELGEPKTSFQGGILAEYYFARHWSLSGKIKYFDTGVSFYQPDTHTGGWLDLGSDEYRGLFKGSTIAVPISLKWEFRVFRNFGASLKLGYMHSFETKSNYVNYSDNLKTNYPKEYGSSVAGFGFNYFLNKKTAVYIDVENYLGGRKAKIPTFIFDNDKFVMNRLISLGVKYSFKK